jgi:Mn-dependent DtxR family transcriptional regulator
VGLKDALVILRTTQSDAGYIENTNAEMQALLGVSHNTFDRYMRDLIDMGYVTRTQGQGKVRTVVAGKPRSTRLFKGYAIGALPILLTTIKYPEEMYALYNIPPHLRDSFIRELADIYLSTKHEVFDNHGCALEPPAGNDDGEDDEESEEEA